MVGKIRTAFAFSERFLATGFVEVIICKAASESLFRSSGVAACAKLNVPRERSVPTRSAAKADRMFCMVLSMGLSLLSLLRIFDQQTALLGCWHISAASCQQVIN